MIATHYTQTDRLQSFKHELLAKEQKNTNNE